MNYIVTSMEGETDVDGVEDGDEYVVGVIEDAVSPYRAVHEATERSKRSQEFWDGKEFFVYPVAPTVEGGLACRRERFDL